MDQMEATLYIRTEAWMISVGFKNRESINKKMPMGMQSWDLLCLKILISPLYSNSSSEHVRQAAGDII